MYMLIYLSCNIRLYTKQYILTIYIPLRLYVYVHMCMCICIDPHGGHGGGHQRRPSGE